jgi:uncharacterized membrane protein
MLALVQAQLHQHNMLLPPPEVLESYERLIPGSAARLMSQVERQGDHRRALETTAVKAGHRNQLVGTCTGGVVCAGVIVVAALASVNGQALAAVLMVGLVIVGLRADSALTVDVSVEELSGHYARHPFDPFLFGPAPALSHLLVGLDP